MTKGQSIGLVIAGGLVLAVGSLVGLYFLGVPGTGLSLGALIPLALTCHGITRVLARYEENAGGRRR